jgi:hypothetical protein
MVYADNIFSYIKEIYVFRKFHFNFFEDLREGRQRRTCHSLIVELQKDPFIRRKMILQNRRVAITATGTVTRARSCNDGTLYMD